MTGDHPAAAAPSKTQCQRQTEELADRSHACRREFDQNRHDLRDPGAVSVSKSSLVTIARIRKVRRDR